MVDQGWNIALIENIGEIVHGQKNWFAAVTGLDHVLLEGSER